MKFILNKLKSSLLIIIFFGLSISNAYSQGDDCTSTYVNAFPTSCQAGFTESGTTSATLYTGSSYPSACVGDNEGDQSFYWLNTPTNGVINTVSVDGGSDNIVLSIYGVTGGSCTSPTSIACVNNTTSGAETITYTPTATHDYYYAIINSFGSGDGATFDICAYEGSGGGGAAPANDLCTNATSLPCGTTTLAGSTTGATNVTDPTGCANTSDYGVWYTFTGDGQSTTITVANSGFDVGFSIVSGASCGGTLTSIACVDDFNTSDETHTFTSTNGTNYYVYVSHYDDSGSSTGNFTISRSCSGGALPPVNDLCANATSLPCGTTDLAGTTVNATNTSAPTCSETTDYGVWYTFVGDGDATNITVKNGTMNVAFTVQSGTCGSLSSEACVGDYFGLDESHAFTTVNGTTYFVYVAYGESGTTTGTFTISRSCPNAPVGCSGGAGGNDCPVMQPMCTDATYCYTAGIGSVASSGNDYGCLSTQAKPSW